MKARYTFAIVILAALAAAFGPARAFLLTAQDINGVITQGERPAVAVPDLRGSGDAQQYMDGFNDTLWNELSGSGVLKMVAKSMYPLEIPQQPADFKPPTVTNPVRRGEQPRTVKNGPWLTDWSSPPAAANYLAFGYTAVQDGRLVLFGWLFNVGQPDVQNAQVIGKLYFGTLNAEGARQVARDFAADILRQFGGQSLSGTKIFFVSDRTRNKEIWSMDYDGTNQRAVTAYKSISNMPAVSADGKMVAFTTYARGNPQIMIHSTENGRRLNFYNPVSSVVETPEFTPDGKHVLFAAAIDGWVQLCVANVDGGQMQRLSHVRAIEVSPRVNPKTGTDILFISGRSGAQQLWRMNMEGGDLERLTPGDGDVSNPAWSPDGHHIAFAWTHGYEPGNFNIFVMDIGDRKPIQLTHGMGRSENPSWAPDGVHIVFSSKRGSTTQIYSMLADGTNVQQLTTQGNNLQPVWTKGIN
jgi:TolB protein